jgi:hypothetical protein
MRAGCDLPNKDAPSAKPRAAFVCAVGVLHSQRGVSRAYSAFTNLELKKQFGVEQAFYNGVCDFLISRSPYQADIEAPVVVTVEAKQDDFRKGTTQCIAEMIAARLFNEQQGRPIDEIYGCVTTGDVWRFLVLRGQPAMVETTAYDIREDLERILGILLAMSLNQIAPAS